ncbi:MAG: prepilin-type N-terminal cleavage/methylation domain-containing protein [Gammaproteobacteria bacterium]|nr:prepilin-type N-terminal cleavage/methylation domain-containing protein [Gammaproteobacteria bacterium]
MKKSVCVHGHGTGIRQQQGFSLLEVLLAAAVMGSGLAGLAALLLAAVGGTLETSQRGQALLLAGSMAAVMQVTPAGVASFISPAAGAECAVGERCEPGRFASAAVRDWRSQVANRLPGGRGLVCLDSTPWDGSASEPSCDGAEPVVVKVFWSGPPASQAADQRVVQVLP